MTLATGKTYRRPPAHYSPVDSAEVTGVMINADGSGFLQLAGGLHLNFERGPAGLTRLHGAAITLTSGTVLLGEGVKARRIAERLSPKRVRFVGAPEDWFGGKMERLI